MLLLYVLIIVYILAINFYAVLLLNSLKNDWLADESKLNAGDGKLLLTAILGGAIGVYVTMFVTKFKIRNILLMTLLPVIAVLNVWLFYIAFRSGLTFLII